MIKWEDLTDLQRARATYSDLYKDVYGCRPDYDGVDQWSFPEINEQIKCLTDLLRLENDNERIN